MSISAAAMISPVVTGGVLARVGHWLGAPLASDLDAMKLAERGLSSAQFRRVADRFHLPMDLPAPESTVRRREKKKERFTQAESEKVLRVLAEVSEFFGSDAQALQWMRRPAHFIPDKPDTSPMQMAASEIGARHLEGLLRRSAYGMF